MEALGRAVFASSVAGIVRIDADARFLMVNDRFCEIVGRGRDELLDGMCWFDITHPDDRERTRRCVTSLLEGAEQLSIETRYLRRDASAVWVHNDVSAMRGPSGLLEGAVAVVTDITERKQAEQALVHSQLRYRSLFDRNYDAVFSFDLNGCFTSMNDRVAEITGYSREELMGSSFEPLVVREKVEETFGAFLRVVQGEQQMVETTIRHKDGRRIDVTVTGIPIIIDGAIEGVYGIARDVTEHRRAEQALLESEERFASFMTNLPAAAWIKDGDGKYVFANDEAVRIFNTPREQLYGRTDAEVFPPATARDFAANDQRVRRQRAPVQTIETLEQQDGLHHSLVAKFPIRDDDSAPCSVGGVAIDVTEQRLAEQQRAFIAEASAILGSSLDYETTLQQFARLTVPALADICTVEILEPDGSMHRVALAHVDPAKEAVIRQLDSRFNPDPRGDHPLRRALKTRKAQLFERATDEEMRRASRDATHFEMLKGLGLFSVIMAPLIAHNNVLGAITLATAESRRQFKRSDVAFVEDLAHRAALALDNARLYREGQRTQDDLRRANEAKDEFLSLVSHELRTPITTIYGGIRLLQRPPGEIDAADRTEMIADIAHESERLRRLIEDLLTLSRLELGQPISGEPLLLHRELARIVTRWKQHNAAREVQISADERIAPVTGDPTYVEQVLRNLLSNADKYSPADKPIVVQARRHGRASASVTLLDEGPGVSADQLETIFEPFYRAREAPLGSSGAGIGLAVCRRLVEVQGGQIWAEMRPSGGLRVTFTLPLAPEVI